MSRSNLIKKSKDKIRNKEMQNIKMTIKDKKNVYKIKKIKEEEEKNGENVSSKVVIKDNKNKENSEKKEEKKNNEGIIKDNNNSKIKDNNKDNLILLYEDNKIKDQEEKIIYFDTTKINNVQIPKEYLNIIYYNLLKEEMIELKPKAFHTYMETQKEINEQMRSILVDWIIDVHHKFGFTDETLFMTILIIDRYCSIENITRIKYQCLGITSLMIACKHEEINVPKVEDFIYITDNAYRKDEVFQMEKDVLDKLNFSLLYPSPIKFYEYLSLHFNFSKKYHMLGKYLMESFLLDLKYIKYKPSVISCACTYIVMKFFKMPNYRNSYEKKFYLVDENINDISYGFGVKDCAQDICVFIDNINNTNLLSCQKKYTKTEFENVASLINKNK
jgi:cyclin B